MRQSLTVALALKASLPGTARKENSTLTLSPSATSVPGTSAAFPEEAALGAAEPDPPAQGMVSVGCSM